MLCVWFATPQINKTSNFLHNQRAVAKSDGSFVEKEMFFDVLLPIAINYKSANYPPLL
jgi:hypothetical protein